MRKFIKIWEKFEYHEKPINEWYLKKKKDSDRAYVWCSRAVRNWTLLEPDYLHLTSAYFIFFLNLIFSKKDNLECGLFF